MKLRLEPQKTTLRLSKDEFRTFTNSGVLHQETVFPDGNKIIIAIELGESENLTYNNNFFQIILPAKKILDYKPRKAGIPFAFQLDDGNHHTLLFEVDIKRAPLSARN